MTNQTNFGHTKVPEGIGIREWDQVRWLGHAEFSIFRHQNCPNPFKNGKVMIKNSLGIKWHKTAPNGAESAPFSACIRGECTRKYTRKFMHSWRMHDS